MAEFIKYARSLDQRTVEVERPTRCWVTNPNHPEIPDEVEDTIDGLTLVPDGDRCQSHDCAWGAPTHIGWVLQSRTDGWGNETEGTVWVTPWRHPDGRLLCEDDSVRWDEGEDL